MVINPVTLRTVLAHNHRTVDHSTPVRLPTDGNPIAVHHQFTPVDRNHRANTPNPATLTIHDHSPSYGTTAIACPEDDPKLNITPRTMLHNEAHLRYHSAAPLLNELEVRLLLPTKVDLNRDHLISRPQHSNDNHFMINSISCIRSYSLNDPIFPIPNTPDHNSQPIPTFKKNPKWYPSLTYPSKPRRIRQI